MEFYDVNEIIAIAASSIVGTAGYIGFLYSEKNIVMPKRKIIARYGLSLFAVYLFSEILKVFAIEHHRGWVLLLVSFMASYLMKFIDQNSTSIFNRILDAIISAATRAKTDNYYYDEDIHNENDYNEQL